MKSPEEADQQRQEVGGRQRAGGGVRVSVSRDRVSVRGQETALETMVVVAEWACCPSCARKRGHDGGLTFVRYLL